jgi:putative DNA methylase
MTPVRRPSMSVASEVDNNRALTLLETALPWVELSLLATADQRSRDPAYGAHRWWARRPPAVMRGLLLAAALTSETTLQDFWNAFASPAPRLEGLRVHDPFTGGGSTLVEAQRLGARVTGTDVDPLAALITNFVLNPPLASQLTAAGDLLLAHLNKQLAHLFPSSGSPVPLHYFSLRTVTCPECGHEGPLYRNLIVARDLGKVGGVVRDHPLTVFCPTCLTLHHLNRPDRIELRCCDRRHRIDDGTFSATRYTCPCCERRWTHSGLKSGVAPRWTIAVEETSEGNRRCVRPPTQADLDANVAAGAELVRKWRRLDLPTACFADDRRDRRPLSYGVTKPVELFSARQLLCFGTAFAWLDTADLDARVRQGMTLALSNALATNNLLCGYASDYGRLSALFSVRSYSLPALAVELNPLHPDGGRGTLMRSVHRVVRSTTTSSRRHVWSVERRRTEIASIDFGPTRTANAVSCASATEAVVPNSSVDICVTDPPYYDFISYSELSEFYRVWLGLNVDSEPLLPTTGADGVETFASTLGGCLRRTSAALRKGRPLAFTYHATSPEAWEAIGLALDEAKLVITALWPLRNDAHMGHHSFAGNCEWDVVVVCRPLEECERTAMSVTFQSWVDAARKAKLRFNAADERNIAAALAMSSTRFACHAGADSSLGEGER